MSRLEPLLGESREQATERVLSRIRAYVEHESPSGDVERCTALAEQIARDLEELGARTSLISAPGQGAHVLADLPQSGSEKHILVLGHLDTVHPVGTLSRQPFTVSQDRVTGPGCYDMKSGVALMVEALAALRRAGRAPARSLRMLVTCDEEVGSHTSRRLIEEQARDAHAVLVPEPSLAGGGAKTSRKGVATYRISVEGRAAHAGVEPERGVNAIAELAYQVLAVQVLADPGLGTTVSVGTIQGGTATNVIPASAAATIDVRVANAAEGARIFNAITALAPRNPAARIEVHQIETRPPLERTPQVVELFMRARTIASTLGVELGEGGTGGGSDGCLTAAIGIPTLDGLGPQGGGAHAVDEHVLVGDLAFRLAFYTALLEEL